MKLKDLPEILVNAAETTGIVMVLVMAAGALGWCMSISRIPQMVAPALVAAIHQPLVFLFASNLILLVVGCFMEALAALLILIPIMVPAAISFGVDPVQFGVIMILNLILGAATFQSDLTSTGAGYTERVRCYGDLVQDQVVSASGGYSATATLTQSTGWTMRMVAFAGAQ